MKRVHTQLRSPARWEKSETGRYPRPPVLLQRKTWNEQLLISSPLEKNVKQVDLSNIMSLPEKNVFNFTFFFGNRRINLFHGLIFFMRGWRIYLFHDFLWAWEDLPVLSFFVFLLLLLSLCIVTADTCILYQCKFSHKYILSMWNALYSIPMNI